MFSGHWLMSRGKARPRMAKQPAHGLRTRETKRAVPLGILALLTASLPIWSLTFSIFVYGSTLVLRHSPTAGAVLRTREISLRMRDIGSLLMSILARIFARSRLARAALCGCSKLVPLVP